MRSRCASAYDLAVWDLMDAFDDPNTGLYETLAAITGSKVVGGM